MIRISLDVMGGDFGPEIVIPGAAKALERHPDITFLLFGLQAECEPYLAKHPKLRERSVFHDCELAVGMDEKPSAALRRGRYVSTMWRSIEAVKLGEADVVVSAGNTGALMAMSKFCLRTLAHIERPAIAGIWPTLKGESIVLDIGATIGADAHQLMDFALMGGAMARALFEAQRPTVGLLNVGVEEVKGQEEVKEAGRLIREANLPTISYHGFVEGDDIGKGTVDVVVTEGFTGNIALKTAEGTARQIAELLREAMSRTWLSKLGYLLAKGAFDRLREKMDPRKVNGGVFLGLNGIVIKSHGGTDAEGFAAAIDVGYDMARNGLTEKIVEDLETYHARRQPPAGPEAA
ncbi:MULTISPECIES: phosphate acyltransferase PlsX [Pseudorhizobium]|uniref:Phosphate acyltransferase n=1 Tax=Pseudorhizobium pelagicum TaxID=1509405 RepID=A0A922NWZ7_9HYPH|nr:MULTISPECIES: phosphate acyltransferase PlsX [Pseudorhizobium]MBA4785419.1 phosphate acyltransferase PlsX [Hyphomicrobiales bacterium]MBU1317415.1 phosphate acyltransferase PlsX [Alphaproteobacteria bacterium]MDY6962642.1 phosphate acyltransferase PlsX [Pseudomonadota bacterium]KEQ03312.1 phosphate acyltransferase [Pseudorhizobium pelagicum]KEQ06886.1 phosphate acyltransferase [Pseudorhizobium pelagicum]